MTMKYEIGYEYPLQELFDSLNNRITPSNYVMDFMGKVQDKKEKAIENLIIEMALNYIEASVKEFGFTPSKALKVLFDRNILEVEYPENGKSKFVEKDGKWSFMPTLPEAVLRPRKKYERKQLALYILIKNKLNNNEK